MFGDRFSSSTTCSRWRHETEPGRLDQSLSCRFWKVATHPIDGLVAQGYGHSEIPDANVCAPNPGTVIVSGKITRYLEDGGVMGEVGATYIYGQTPDGWRIHATIGHDAEAAIGCLK